jgi:hypothetical protein
MEVLISENATCFGVDAHPPENKAVNRRSARERWRRIGK